MNMGKKLKIFILYAKLLLDFAIDFFFSLYWDKRKKPIPDLESKHAILKESATALAKKIRNKELKSEDLVRAVVERIKEVNWIFLVFRQRQNKTMLKHHKNSSAYKKWSVLIFSNIDNIQHLPMYCFFIS